ncbi:SDR family NAD(P)-dependent oxidoreductase [Psychrobacter sp. I-STPA10]|uniref:SDR family NAD(P)-dependent oxidoreductase n=1 Tax=Psychrobacter sp. I-STPA10 TaxID=2585769 RepID=UPI001E5F1A5F|nr:SDR family NAD(P)-dependent oxidoreductase [Psychrobacter sp. I-STPA10]
MQLQGKTFIVTGGASGLGAATTRELVDNGANVVIADLNEEKGQALASELGQAAQFVRCDVTSSDEVQQAVDTAEKEFGELYGSVNCAGIVVVQKLLDRENNPADLDKFAKGVQVNLVGTFNVARLVAASIAKRVAAAGGVDNPESNTDQGVIINTASIAAFDGQVGQGSYASSKAGVVGLTLPLARELARHGIRVMTVAPGIFNTPMMQSLPEKAKVQLESSVPYPKRLGSPQEFAQLICHIISNAYLNGEVIRLDGAIRMV